MHPGMFYRWKQARKACGRARAEGGTEYEASGDGGLGREFGVRRPLRFMAHKLDLDDEQVKQLARVLNDLKTERAQAAVDHQRTVSGIADVFAADTFDAAAAKAALDQRVQTAERLRDEVLAALEKTHAMLSPEQRAKLAYMLQAGTLTI